MKAISLWQPWASAIALGVKRIETRHWSTAYRGPLAIHAAKRWDGDQRHFAALEYQGGRLPRNIPLGVIVAVVDLVDVWRTVDLLTDNKVGEVEMRYGNYLSGRFGWLFENIRALPDPVPYKGAQGLFNVPDELLA